MFGIENLALFVFSGFLLNITPGADMVYIISRSSSQGFKMGIIAALGIAAGCLFHITLAMVGLSVILATSAVAFTIVKLIGAAYLIYLGCTLILSNNAKENSVTQPVKPCSPLKVFSQGMLINALNPKVALFFLAFVPQFIASSSPDKVAAFFTLGIIFNIVGTLWNIGVAYSSSIISNKIKKTNIFGQWIKKAAGSLFVGLGIKLALSDKA